MKRVTRLCCLNGNCARCLPHGQRVRIIVADRLTDDDAARLMMKYVLYLPEVEAMTPEAIAAAPTAKELRRNREA